jgi:hypothetical protein
MPTLDAPEDTDVAVKMNHLRATRALQQLVDILGQDMRSIGPRPLPFGDGAMGLIGLRLGAGLPPRIVKIVNRLEVVLPRLNMANRPNGKPAPP